VVDHDEHARSRHGCVDLVDQGELPAVKVRVQDDEVRLDSLAFRDDFFQPVDRRDDLEIFLFIYQRLDTRPDEREIHRHHDAQHDLAIAVGGSRHVCLPSNRVHQRPSMACLWFLMWALRRAASARPATWQFVSRHLQNMQ